MSRPAANRYQNLIGASSPLLRTLVHQRSISSYDGEGGTEVIPDDPRMAERARNSLLDFARYTYQAEYDEDRREAYQVNFHHEIIAKEIDDWLDGTNPLLCLSVPPQFGKSELASRRLPAYAFGKNPNEQFLEITYTDDPAKDFALDVRSIMETDRYRQVFPGVRIMSGSGKRGGTRARNDARSFRILGAKGRYFAGGIGAAITGKPASIIVFDDPFKDDVQAQSPSYRRKVWNFFNKVARTRGTKNVRILVIHTRWHEEDLIGKCLEEMKTGVAEWRNVVLRAEARADDPDRHPDDKRKPGELLWPEFKDEAALAPLRALVDTWNSLYQQDPGGIEGKIFRLDWLQNRWDRLPTLRGEWIWVIDPKGGSVDEDSSRFILQLWFRPEDEERIYLIDQKREILEIDECLDLLLAADKDPLWARATNKIFEKKADGAGLVKLYRNAGGRFITTVSPSVSKILRWKPTRPFWRDGFVVLPSDENADWLHGEDGFITEHKGVPYVAHDDQVDASTMAIEYYFMPHPADGEDNAVEEYWEQWRRATQKQ